jgi:predicted site-specific integrase-resolvase
MTTNISDPLITEGEAAAILRVSLTSLRRWRREGSGPVYRKLSRSVRYRREDLAEFLAAARRTSTSGARDVSRRRAA